MLYLRYIRLFDWYSYSVLLLIPSALDYDYNEGRNEEDEENAEDENY